MIYWFAVSLCLSVIQISFYRLSAKKVADIGLFYIAALLAGMFAAATIQYWFAAAGIEWWTNVVVSFAAILIGELFFVFLHQSEKNIEKKNQSLPSFFSLSNLYVMLAWLNKGQQFSNADMWMQMIYISFASVLFLFIMVEMSQRLRWNEVPVAWRGLPILLIAAALFLLSLYGWQ